MTTDSSASGRPPTTAPGQFTRASSGLVRQLSIRDTAWYGIIAAGVTFGFFLLFPVPQAASPGIYVFGTCALAFVVAVPIYFVYAAFGSAMPRAGGDYVYESRTIGPFLGFVVPMTCQVIAFLPFIVSAALVAAQSGFAPIFDAIGLHGLAADVATTKNGAFISVVVLTAIMFVINVLGLRVYRQIQRYVMIPMIILSVVTIYVLLFVNLGTSFESHFSSFSAPLTAQDVHQKALAAGYQPSGYSFRNTVIWVTPLLALVPFSMFAAMGLLGEVRSANNLGRLFRAFLIPGFVVAFVILGIPYLLLQHIAGNQFLTEFAVALDAGKIAPAYYPSVQAFLAMLSNSAPITILIALGFIVGGFGFANTIFVNTSRIMMAMGLERSLPNVFGQVSRRFHTPVKNLTLYALASLAVTAVYIYKPSYGLTLIISTTILSAVIIAITSFSAALFPFRAREIYEASPVSRWLIGSVPLITVVGLIGGVVVAIFVYLALTESALGLTTPGARITMAVEFGAALLIYVANRLVQHARGFDPSLAARTIPPD
jgi:basic amino acid/polyamine antiporter, APA family